MSACDTSIEITGEIRSQEDLDALVAAIVKDQPTTDWSGETLVSEDQALNYIRATFAGDEVLTFAENERHGNSFPQIEAVCRKIGLAYERTVSVDEEHDTAGSRQIWNPATGELLDLVGMDPGVVSASDVLPMLKAGKVSEAIAFLEKSLDPAHGIPETFEVATGLLDVPAVQMG